MKDLDYDQRYLATCREIDALRAIAGLYETSLSDEIEHIHNQMSLFWGNFKNVLRLTALGEKPTADIAGLADAQVAAREIGSTTISLKTKLTALAEWHRASSSQATTRPLNDCP